MIVHDPTGLQDTRPLPAVIRRPAPSVTSGLEWQVRPGRYGGTVAAYRGRQLVVHATAATRPGLRVKAAALRLLLAGAR